MQPRSVDKIKFSRAITLIVFLGCVVGIRCAQAESIVARAGPKWSSDVVSYLADHTLESDLFVPKGTNVIAALESTCGSLHPAYLQILQQRNNGVNLRDTDADRTITVPGCFHRFEKYAMVIKKGDNPSNIALKYLGFSGTGAIKSLNLDPFPPVGAKVTIPYASFEYRYELKPGEDQATVRKNLAEMSGLSQLKDKITRIASENDQGAPIRPRPDQSNALDENAADSCSVGDWNPTWPWPYDQSRLHKVLSYNQNIRRSIGLGSYVQTPIAIIDSGLDGFSTERFPGAFFKINAMETVGDVTEDLDHNGWYHDVYGINVNDTREQPIAVSSAISGFDDYFHGTHVAGLALGGPSYYLGANGADISDRVGLQIISLVYRDQNAYTQPAAGLGKAMSYVAKMNGLQGGVYVVNISFESATPTDDITPTLLLNPSLLMVVAAGNDQTDLAEIPRYPASYGGSGGGYSDHVITVGAVTPIGQPAYFSNYSIYNVDLFAPGCEIESFIPGGQKARYNGTSFSAPQVSFSAGLLAAEVREYKMDASWIKWRILTSVDIEYVLASSAVSSGVLNIAKALAIYQDVVSEGDDNRHIKKIRFGRIIGNKYGQIKLCDSDDGPRDLGQYWKINPNYHWSGDGSDRELHYLKRDPIDGRPRESNVKCDLPSDDLQFIDDEEGLVSIPWAHILDIVPAAFKGAK